MSNEDLIELMTAKIISGNRNTTAENVREVVTAMVESFQNLDGLDIEYLGIVNSRVDVNFINSDEVHNQNLVLQGDGTWRNSAVGKVNLSCTGAQTTFTVTHNAGFIPSSIVISAGSADAARPVYANNFTLTQFDVVFITAPILGTNNVSIHYNIS